jgi:DUF2934 family protein
MIDSKRERTTGQPGGRQEDINDVNARTPDSEQDRERIARRAYERFEERGREPGHDQEDWFQAERETNERSDD